jgi:chorismate mutase/prephenate dehydratase
MLTEPALKNIRTQLDVLDDQILALINQRASLAVEVGKIKRKTGMDQVFYRPEREAQILQNVIKGNSGPLNDRQVTAIFRPLLTACLNLQQPIKVAFLGPEGTYSQAAVYKHFGLETMTFPTPSIERVFREIETNNAAYGVVPIENSTTGVINTTLDALLLSPLKICGEIILPIQQHLLGLQKDFSSIKRVYAHEQSLMQCQHWLDNHLPQVERVPVSSNGAAAKLAANDRHSAALAGDLAAVLYNLELLVPHVTDNPQNETRFLILGEQKVAPSGVDKTSLLIASPHTPGSLFELIKPFVDHGVNISLIESRPCRDRNWSYLFFLDIEGHQEDVFVKQALELLAKKTIMLNILGSYPKAVI